MLDSFQIYEELSKTIGDEAAKSLTKTLTKIYDDLSNTVTKVEFNELKEIVSELAEAQKKTEESLNKLIKRVDNIEVQLGGLSMAVGYGIEDKLYPHISKFAQKYFGITVEDTVLRKNVIYPDGKFDEINLYISGKKDEKDVLVLGECKAQPGKKDIDKFMKMVSRLKDFFKKEIFPFVVGYTFNPIVEQYILKRYPELKFFKTYEIEYEKY